MFSEKRTRTGHFQNPKNLQILEMTESKILHLLIQFLATNLQSFNFESNGIGGL